MRSKHRSRATATACLLCTALTASLHPGGIINQHKTCLTVPKWYMKQNFADQVLGCVPHNVSAFLQTLLHPGFYVRAGHALCHFGTLPGGWIRSQEGSPFPLHSEDGGAFPTWQPYSQDCQLKPLLGPYLQVASHCAQCILLLHSCMSYDCMS